MHLIRRMFAAAVLVGSSVVASAAPVLWTIEDFFLTDGGAVTGSYVYDATLDLFSDVNVNASAGSVLGAGSFTFSGAFASASIVDTYESLPADLTGVRSLYFELAASMTNAGGTIAVTGYLEPLLGNANVVDGFCLGSDCANYDPALPARGPDFTQATPRVVGTLVNVPLPASLALIAIGLVGFSVARRRHG